MTNAERWQLQQALDILNRSAKLHGGRVYMGSFMLAAALQAAIKVVEDAPPRLVTPKDLLKPRR